MFDGSSATPDEPVSEDLPGEFLADDLNDPEPYEVSADETEAEELTQQPAPDEESIDDEDQLVAAESVAQQARSSRPVRRAAAGTHTEGKGRPTAKRADRRAHDGGRVGPLTFAEQSVDELKKVVWPTWSQVSSYFWAVLVFVLVIIAYVSLLDLGLGAALLKLFG